jgi:hypothetical protein
MIYYPLTALMLETIMIPLVNFRHFFILLGRVT